ncbi:MAG: helix-turn-helix domain-containing protein [Patescibacteria group bacterium]|nr:helix-turn-helix domain-containing protein [Patescibacteria group bacterium]
MLLNKFKTKKVETVLTVGECLKRKREELNISLENVSEKLKVKISYLENLEKGDYEKLPPDVFVKGFIKSYARLMGMNSEKMVGIYVREKKIGDKIEKKHQKKKIIANKLTTKNFAIITPKIVTAFLSLLILFIVGYYLWYQISSFNSTPYLFVASPYEDQIVNDSEITIEGETEKETVIRINGQDVFVNPHGYFKEEITLQAGKNVLIIEATNKFDRTAKETRNIIYEKKSEPIEIEIKNEEKSDDDTSEVDLEKETEYNIEVIGP